MNKCILAWIMKMKSIAAFAEKYHFVSNTGELFVPKKLYYKIWKNINLANLLLFNKCKPCVLKLKIYILSLSLFF